MKSDQPDLGPGLPGQTRIPCRASGRRVATATGRPPASSSGDRPWGRGPAVRTTPAPRGPDGHLLVRPPPGPSLPQGAAAPGDSDPIPDREIGEDLQQDRVGQVGKSRHDPVDTHFRFRLKELGGSPCGSPKKRGEERVRTGRWSQLPVAGGVSAFLLRGCGWTWEPDQHGIRTLHRGLGRGLGPSPGGVAKAMTNPGRG